ncbi:unnamed protein product [Knipowitschia caucasica]
MDASKPPLGRRMKPRAPPPPQAPQAPQAPQPAPRRLLRVADSQDGAGDREMKENMLSRTVELRLTLPTGHQTTVTEDGSKALMDVLVELCSCYHLNPSLHTLELFTPEGQSLGFKPNVLLGSLNVACVLIKEKVLEERQVRRSAPKVPEKTVRLLVNYHGSQKAVVRVNPLLPLQELVPIVCDKCEFDPALVVLLKDSISRQKLPLDETLSTLGIKELYVHDKSLVLQPKMASAPALNLTDCLRYSTNSLARAEKKGLLGMFQFGRRKSKTETTSLDMEDYNDTETHSKALSSMYGSQFSEERLPMSQSHSAMNISRTSPKADAKKRRAPAPPGIPSHSTEHLNSDANMMGLGSDTEQRKRKAPAPPPTPPSLSYDSEDFSATATPVSQHNQAIASESTTLTTTVEIDAIKPVTPSTVHLKQSAICLEIRSSTPSSITSDSLIAQDSSSELSPSLEESDASSQFSTTTGSMVSEPAQAQSITKSSVSRTEKSEGSTNISASDMTTASSSRSDTVSAMNLKMEETKNNRHSGVAWLQSMQSTVANDQGKEMSPEETVSLGSSSSGMSLADPGEDSGLVSSPSETQTTSPDGSLSLDGSTGGERRVGTATDNFSDSDEGSWGSRHRRRDVPPHPKTDKLKQPDLSAQLHQTLADLESSLADSNEVPFSIVDHDVPVTTIDEVLPDEGFWAESIANKASNYSDELHNRNNNAHTATETNKGASSESKQHSKHKSIQDSRRSKTHQQKDTTLDTKTPKKESDRSTSLTTVHNSHCSQDQEQKGSHKRDAKPVEKMHQATPTPLNQEDMALPRTHHTLSTSKPVQTKITPNATSRFGMKTFTVVPLKAAVSHAPAGESVSTTPGAIKIDEQGNMVKVFPHRTPTVSDLKNDSSLLGKANTFWSSNEKQEGTVAPKIGHSDKARESRESNKSDRTKTFETTHYSTKTEGLKSSHGTLFKSTAQTEPKPVAEQIKHIDLNEQDCIMIDDKISPAIILSQRSVQTPCISEVERDLSFLKPPRRTSSQYVASAISKYVPKPTTKPDYNPSTQEFLTKTQNTGYQKSGRSMHINPQHSNVSSLRSISNTASPKRSMSSPEYISDRQDSIVEVEESSISKQTVGFGKGSFRIPESHKLSNNQSLSQLNVKASDKFKLVQQQSPSPSPICHELLTDKPPTDLKNGHQQQALKNPDTTSPSDFPKTDKIPSLTVTESPGSPEETVFGPIKKFKPVICKSVEKETSLHSSLMEAIQSGGGKDRLKKIPISGANVKTLSYVEEENERCALMAAIRAQGNSGRLRKTKSGAAEELENVRKTAFDVNSSGQISSMPPSPQSMVPSPMAPAPPPPVLPAPKPFTLSQPNMNSAVAREAMLEAIRTGSAAEKLKKVAVPAKTVQVNGRLGTIKATSSTAS